MLFVKTTHVKWSFDHNVSQNYVICEKYTCKVLIWPQWFSTLCYLWEIHMIIWPWWFSKIILFVGNSFMKWSFGHNASQRMHDQKHCHFLVSFAHQVISKHACLDGAEIYNPSIQYNFWTSLLSKFTQIILLTQDSIYQIKISNHNHKNCGFKTWWELKEMVSRGGRLGP